jgi:hypothetical protein
MWPSSWLIIEAYVSGLDRTYYISLWLIKGVAVALRGSPAEEFDFISCPGNKIHSG